MKGDKVNTDISKLQNTIQEFLGWGNVSTWHSRMFDELSDKIFQETSVMISVPTLKRFFGVVKHEGSPSVTTLDTLSKFVGYENWRSFKTAQPAPKKKYFKATASSVKLLQRLALGKLLQLLASAGAS